MPPGRKTIRTSGRESTGRIPCSWNTCAPADLDSHADEVIKAYKEAFQHGTPHERDSALGQLRFLRDAAPPKDGPALQRVLDGVS